MSSEQPVFYYDLGSPTCYLMAEQIMSTLPLAPEWEPVAGCELTTDPEQRPPAWSEIARATASLGLQALRPPAVWPPNTRSAMLAATYAKQIGRAVAFSLAAFRQAFAAGRDLGDPDTVMIAAAACELHPTALTRALELRSVADGLANATRRARSAGVESLPAIELGGKVFHGLAGLPEASAALAERA